MIAFIKTNDGSFKVVIDNQSYHFNEYHQNYQILVDSLKNKDEETFRKFYDVVQSTLDWAEGGFEFVSGTLKYMGNVVPQELYARIKQMVEEGFDHKPLLRFIERLYQNPSGKVLKNIWGFLSNEGIPIDENGYIVAYKAVSGDEVSGYFDKWTGKIRQIVGDEVTMLRCLVDEDSDNPCSHGLHAGSLQYAKNYLGSAVGTIMIVLIDPADVVTVPSDYSAGKLGVCRYKILKIEDKVQAQSDYIGRKTDSISSESQIDDIWVGFTIPDMGDDENDWDDNEDDDDFDDEDDDIVWDSCDCEDCNGENEEDGDSPW